MDGKQMMLALGAIDDTLIAQAAQERTFKHRARPAKWIALAASLTVVIAAAVSLPTLLRPPVEPDATPGIVPATESKSGGSEPATTGSAGEDLPAEAVPEVGMVPQDGYDTASIPVSRAELHLNDVDAITANRLYFPPEQYEKLHWSNDEIIAYFGRDLTPSYLPAGITADSGGATVYRKRADGTLAYDNVHRVCGSIDVTYPDAGGIILPEGFELTVSRIGIMNDCVYVLPGEDEIRTSDIAGTVVTIGYREMSYGPYAPETHAPAGTYPLYVFRFTLDGVQYDITTHNLPLDEGVKITASVITGSAAIEIVD